MGNIINNVLEHWGISISDFSKLVISNPSLKGMIVGYIAEFQLKKYLKNNNMLSGFRKDDDHDRNKKGDLVITYKHKEFILESKSLQTNSIKKEGDLFLGKFQCDASDKRQIYLQNEEVVNTTCLRFGEFDIIAVPLFGFTNKWDFAFALNSDLNPSKYKKYPTEIRKQLISSLQKITYPLQKPYTHDIIELLDTLLKKE